MPVMVWTQLILPGSQTFIRNQIDSLQSWRAELFGLARTESPLVRDTDRALYGAGAFESLLRRSAMIFGESRRVRRAFVETRPALVHIHFVSSCAYLVSRVAEHRHIPVILTAHGVDVTTPATRRGIRGALVRSQVSATLRRASLVIAVSEFIRSEVIALGADPSTTIVHHIGIPVPPATPAGTTKQWDIAFVGRFVEKKGVLDLIDAISTLVPEFDPRCIFVGDGPLLERARQAAAAAGIDAHFSGTQPPDVVAATLRATRVFAAPSRTASNGDAEGFGMVFLEAAAAGIPVAATRHGGIGEAVVDEHTGLLSPEGDTAALAANLRRLLDSAELRATMGAAARARVEREFDIREQTRQLERIYDSVARTYNVQQ